MRSFLRWTTVIAATAILSIAVPGEASAQAIACVGRRPTRTSRAASRARCATATSTAAASACEGDGLELGERPLRIGERLQPQRRTARERKHHALAGRGVQAVLRRLADEMRAERIRHNKPRVVRENLARHLHRGRKEQPVAMEAIVHPFLVGAKVLDRGLDLDDPDVAGAIQRHQIGAPPGWQGELADRRESELMQQPRRPPRDIECRRRLTAIDGNRQKGACRHGATMAATREQIKYELLLSRPAPETRSPSPLYSPRSRRAR